jgi:hypothetical protein
MFYWNIAQDVYDRNERSKEDIDESFMNEVQDEQYQTTDEEKKAGDYNYSNELIDSYLRILLKIDNTWLLSLQVDTEIVTGVISEEIQESDKKATPGDEKAKWYINQRELRTGIQERYPSLVL